MCYYFHVYDLIIQMDPFNDAELTPRIRVERFTKVFTFLKDILTEPKYVKLGSGIHQVSSDSSQDLPMPTARTSSKPHLS